MSFSASRRLPTWDAGAARLGCRRRATARLRLRDLDLGSETVKLYETGGKVTSVKPLPVEYAKLVNAALRAGVIGPELDAYVVPMARKRHRPGERDDRVIWRSIERVDERVGVDLYPHSLRAAYAVNFLESHPASSKRCRR